VRRTSVGAFLLAVLTLAAAGQDKSKKAYELVYDDVQVLKQQVDDLRARLDRNAAEIRALQDQVKALADLFRQSVAGQAEVQEGLRAIPAQYQDLLRKLDQLTLDVQRLSAEMAARPAVGVPAVAPTQDERAVAQPPANPPVDTRFQTANPAQTQTQTTPPPPPAPTMSPQEAYSVAYNDYLKGNYDLAVDSFRLYRQQFPESPLADNALYWIGECRYSQRKFEEAIDAFDELIMSYPQGDKAAAAYLKKGLSFVELGRKAEALAALKILVAKYPLEEEARIAQDKIRELEGK
jgi:tol-pal system protein YbgF